jgi:hypothetical protein
MNFGNQRALAAGVTHSLGFKGKPGREPQFKDGLVVLEHGNRRLRFKI